MCDRNADAKHSDLAVGGFTELDGAADVRARRILFAAKAIVSVAICTPVSSRTVTGTFTCCADTAFNATPVNVPLVLSKANT